MRVFCPAPRWPSRGSGKLAGMRTFGTAVQGGEEAGDGRDAVLHLLLHQGRRCVRRLAPASRTELLKLDERVADIIPEFGTNGKEVVTVEQVLLHTGGFPYAPFRPEYWGDREALLEAFQRWRLNWEPDSRFEYHPTSAHWVLTEIIYRRTGKDFRDFIRERVTGPMGLHELFVGMPEEYDPRVAEVCYVGETVEPPGGFGEVTPEAIMRFNGPAARRSGIPGAGGAHQRRRPRDVLPDADQRRRGAERQARLQARDHRVRDEGAHEGRGTWTDHGHPATAA